MALAHDDELQALLQQMRSDPVATGIKKHGPVNPQVKKHKGTSGGDIQIGISKHSHGSRAGEPLAAGASAIEILTERREAELRRHSAGDDVLWNERLRFEGPENDALHACSGLGRLGSAAQDFLDPHEQQRLAADEAVRWRHMSRLAGEFKDMMGGKLGNKWQRHFEKWLYSRRAGCPTCPAGCFPIGPTSETDPELQRKLQATGASAKEAAFLAKMLGKASHKAAAAVSRAAPGKGNIQVKEIVMKEGSRVRTKYVMTCSGVNMEVNADHYHKLVALMRRSSNLALQDSDKLGGAAAAAVFRVLARYSSFQGAHYRAGGFQAAIHGSCFDVLLEQFGCMLECFASPMNCRYEHFCSAHIGTDACFGSIGSFYHFKPCSGSYEANPPFDDATIQRMVTHMEVLLNATAKPLSFAIIIPYLPEQKGWSMVYQSSYKRAHLKVLQAEHGYFEGSQHDRINRFRIAPFDTSVIFLQNEAGRAKWPATKEKLRLLREAFAPKLNLNPHRLGYEGRREDEDSDEQADAPDGYTRPPPPLPRHASGAAAAAMAAGTGRQGDWDCPACGRLVFAKKSICGKCKAAKPASLEIVTNAPPPLESVTHKRGSKERGVGACAGDAVEGLRGGGKKGVVGGGGKGVFGGGG